MPKVSLRFVSPFLVLILLALACNMSSSAPSLPPATPAAGHVIYTQSASTQRALGTDTATSPAIVHHLMPSDVSASGPLFYDVDSSGTGAQHRAPYGDSYDVNLFERPFTQTDMTYVPSLDITTFQISSDGTWYYVFVGLIGNNPNDPINIDYGVEISKPPVGNGDVLVWAQPPYDTTWTTNGVKVYTDPNRDTGGASPEKSDANATTGAPYVGDGYETVIFNQGQGDDPDLAWVRIDPKDSSTVEFAFKTSLPGNSFMWGVWADAGLKDPSKFNYNDRFTPSQAGSPIGGNPNYPIKAIYAVDNTCWEAFGFRPNGYEPHLCPNTPPPAVKKPPKTPPATACLPGVYCGPPTCLAAGTMIDTPNGNVAVEDLQVGQTVWTTAASGARVASTILQTSHVPVPAGHILIHVVLNDGRELWASPGHPTSDGRRMSDLAVGDGLDGAIITKIESLPSDQPATYDILPAGATGHYWANGILMGSTLANP